MGIANPPEVWRGDDDPGTLHYYSEAGGETRTWGWIRVSYGQFFGFARAFDWVDGVRAQIAISHSNDDDFFLTRTDQTECVHLMTVDIKPKFTLRVEITNPGSDDSASAHGHTIITAVNLQAVADLDAQLHVSHSGTGGSYTVAGTGGPIPWASSPDLADEKTPIHPLVHKQQVLNAEHVVMQATCDVSAEADGWDGLIVWDKGDAEAWIFDSVAGVDLHANCYAPAGSGLVCDGYKYIVASWY